MAAALSDLDDSGVPEKKDVLVVLGEHRRPVSFVDSGKGELLSAIRKAFQVEGNCRVFVQIKNEEWGGEFTDVVEGQVIANRSILRAVVERGSPNSPKVRCSKLCSCMTGTIP